ncbi:MAG: hypothetical protein ACW98D_20615, partial [Promethearchaeota archaeon]
MFKFTFTTLILLISISLPFSDQVEFPIYNSTKYFTPLPPGAPPPFRSSETNNYWCALSNSINNDLYEQLIFMDIIIRCYGKYPGGYVYQLSINDNFDNAVTLLRNSGYFVDLIPVEAADKIDEKIWTQTDLTYYDSQAQTIKAEIFFHDNLLIVDIENLTEGLVDSIIYPSDLDSYIHVTVIATCEELIELAANDEIKTVVPFKPIEELIDFARELTKVNELQTGHLQPVEPPTIDWMVDVPYTGDSIWVAINENGSYKHIDFFEIDPNTTPLDTVFRDASTIKTTWGSPAFSLSVHGLMVASTAVGNGWASTQSVNFPTTEPLKWRGVAPKALLMGSTYNGDVNNRSFTEGGTYYSTSSELHDSRMRSHTIGIDPQHNNIHVTAA